MTHTTGSKHWRTMVSQPGQGPILPLSSLKGKEKDVSKKKNFFYLYSTIFFFSYVYKLSLPQHIIPLHHTAPWRPKTQRRLEDRELNQARSKPDTVDRPPRTARILVHHYNSTQYCKTETVFSIFPFLQTNITSQIWPNGGKGEVPLVSICIKINLFIVKISCTLEW